MDQEQARARLRTERAEVADLLKDAEITGQEIRATEDEAGDAADAAQPLAAEGVSDAVTASLCERLAALDRALARLDDGTYGLSVRSGLPIPDERLDADPAAELTVEEAAAAGLMSCGDSAPAGGSRAALVGGTGSGDHPSGKASTRVFRRRICPMKRSSLERRPGPGKAGIGPVRRKLPSWWTVSVGNAINPGGRAGGPQAEPSTRSSTTRPVRAAESSTAASSSSRSSSAASTTMTSGSPSAAARLITCRT